MDAVNYEGTGSYIFQFICVIHHVDEVVITWEITENRLPS